MINFDLFVKWGESKMGSSIIKGDQIRFNSPFCEDSKHHLHCNIKKFWKGLFNCFKSNNKGTVLSLVMKIENCSYDKAMQILGIKKNTELDLNIFKDENAIDFDLLNKEEFQTIVLPEGVIPINNASYWWQQKAISYLQSRQMNYDFFLIGISGRMKARIVIPYYDKNGNLIYYNGRALFANKLRYLGPPKEEQNVGKADVIFFKKWFTENQKVFICEGEFDAIALHESNLVAGAIGGKHVSIKQATILANKQICLAFDNDEAGRSSVENSYKLLKSFGCQVSFVHPPHDIKDWNEFLILYGKNVLNAYMMKSHGDANF